MQESTSKILPKVLQDYTFYIDRIQERLSVLADTAPRLYKMEVLQEEVPLELRETVERVKGELEALQSVAGALERLVGDIRTEELITDALKEMEAQNDKQDADSTK